MNMQSSAKPLVESGLLTAITLVMILISNFIPGMYIVFMFVWPLPLALIKIKYGTKYSLISLVSIMLISIMISDVLSAVNFTATAGILGITLGYCIK